MIKVPKRDLDNIKRTAYNAERSIYLASHEPLQAVLNFNLMADGVQTMVSKSLDALIRMDTKLAQIVLTLDDEIDDLNRECTPPCKI